MRVFVTGATGFLGSYVTEDLLARGHTVAVLLRPESDPWRLRKVRSQLHAVAGSLDDIDKLRTPVKDFAPDCVVHMAWDGVANRDRDKPEQARNIARTVELAMLSADVGAGSFLGSGSQAEYGPHGRQISETDAARPTTEYGRAKLAAGAMTAQLAAERRLRFAWLRVFSTYGPKDADHWLIPSMIKTLRQGRRMSLTLGEQLWGFLYASDAASAFRTVAESEKAEGIYNVGSPDAPPLRQTVTMLRDMINPAAELGFGDVPYRADQIMVLQANIDRLRALGWRPQVPLERGLRSTVEWYETKRGA